MLGVCALTLAPWTARNAAVTGYFVPFSSNLGMNLMIGNEPQASGVYRRGTDYLGMAQELVGEIEPAVARDRALAGSVVEQIAESPLRFARLALGKLIYLWSPLALGESMQRNLIALLSSGPLLMLGGVGSLAAPWPTGGLGPGHPAAVVVAGPRRLLRSHQVSPSRGRGADGAGGSDPGWPVVQVAAALG